VFRGLPGAVRGTAQVGESPRLLIGSEMESGLCARAVHRRRYSRPLPLSGRLFGKAHSALIGALPRTQEGAAP
jgi:hypothetical protein